MEHLAIVVPPFTSVDFPSLHATIARDALASNGFKTDIIYLSQEFSNLLGYNNYKNVASIQRALGIGDWISTEILRNEIEFPEKTLKNRRFSTFENYLKKGSFDDPSINFFSRIKVITTDYIQKISQDERWLKYNYILFCCSHQQIGFSLSFAQLHKSEKVILFGSIFKSKTVSETAYKNFKGIYSIIQGDIYEVIEYHGHNIFNNNGVISCGISNRKTLASEKVLHSPNYNEFYANCEFDINQSIIPWRSSYGCEWSNMHHCTFCGLIPEEKGYRFQSAKDAYLDIQEIVNKNKGLDIITSDLLLPKNYLENLFPKIINSDWDITFFYEVRPVLKKDEIRILSAAGVQHVQAGIESFGKSTLKYMEKGSTPLLNIRFLKWAYEYGICVSWIYLYGFQEDNCNTIIEQLELIKYIVHLQPPIDITQVRIERGSPMFHNPQKYGFCDVNPDEPMMHTYPIDFDELLNFSLYFNHEFIDGRNIENLVIDLKLEVSNWINQFQLDQLYYRKGPTFIKVIDLRKDEEKIVTLTGWQHLVFLYLDDIVHESKIISYVEQHDMKVSKNELSSFLEEMKALRLFVNQDSRWLCVVPRCQNRNYGRELMLKRFNN